MTTPPALPLETLHLRMTSREWLGMMALSLIWGASFFLNSLSLRELPPLTIAWARLTIAAVTLWTILLVLRLHVPKNGSLWRTFFILGLFNNALPFSLLVFAQTHISSGLTSIMNATTPLFGVIFAHLFTRDEKMTPLKVTGVLLGLVGVAVMIGGSALFALMAPVETADTGALIGQLAGITAAMCYAGATVYGRRLKRDNIPPLVAATGQITCASVMLLPVVMVHDALFSLPLPGLTTALSLMCLGVVSTAVAYILYFRLLATAGATNITLVTFFIPVTAIVLGVMFLGETLALKHIIGFLLIAVGLACIDGRLVQRLRMFA